MRRHQFKRPPFAIIGLGKLGGAGDQLRIGPRHSVCHRLARRRDLPRAAPLAAEVMELLSRRTEQGTVFHTDARLRPDGEKGLLVNTLEAARNITASARSSGKSRP